jgi:peptidoglycan/LPS O-acetylase OafA/YrhL
MVTTASAFTSTNAANVGKAHYTVLDGLRGVAALMVVLFHVLEAFYDNGTVSAEPIPHGYLAVDFFFLLSGFVVAYAYDDRWGKLTRWDFYKRRLIRLHPMVVLGSLIGAALFYLGKGSPFPLVASTPVWKLLVVMVAGFALWPLAPSMDIRGRQDMYPLDGPAWSLFFEYIANILYALVLNRLSKKALAVLVLLAAALLVRVAIFGGEGDLVGGWSLSPAQLYIGVVRVLFPFCAGVLLMRLGKRIHIRGAFGLCSILLVVALSLPRFGGAHHWRNGLYEALCVMFLFPLIVLIGAGERRTEGAPIRIARFLGELSYPLYITHYPLICIYTAWVFDAKPSLARAAIWGVLLTVTALVIAYASLKLYDEPVRRWLSNRYISGLSRTSN